MVDDFPKRIKILKKLKKDLIYILRKQTEYLSTFQVDHEKLDNSIRKELQQDIKDTENNGSNIISENDIHCFSRPVYMQINGSEKNYLYPSLVSTCFVITSLIQAYQKDKNHHKLLQTKENCINMILNKEWKYFAYTPRDNIYYEDDRRYVPVTKLYKKTEKGFQKIVDSKNTKISLLDKKNVTYQAIVNEENIDLDKIYTELDIANYDVYSTPIILNTLYLLNMSSSAKQNPKIHDALEFILTSIQTGSAKFSSSFPESGFLTFGCLKSLLNWHDIAKNIQISDTNVQGKPKTFEDIIGKVIKWIVDQIHEQITYYATEQHEQTDPIRCIFVLSIYKLLKEHEKKFTVLHVPLIEQQITDKIISYVLKDQEKSGLWKKYRAIATLPSDGAVYPFALYSLENLIDNSDITTCLFTEYTDSIAKAITWINQNEQEKIHVPHTNQNLTSQIEVSGWRSPHKTNPIGPPEAWSTALVFDSVNQMLRKINSDLTKDIALHYDGTYRIKPNENELKIKEYPLKERRNFYYVKEDPKKEISYIDNIQNSLTSTSIENSSSTDPNANKSISIEQQKFGEFIISEFVDMNDSSEINTKGRNAIILHGPPGTGKTTLTEDIAELLGWSFVRIDTSNLLRQGFEQAAVTIDEVFDHLANLEKTVVLFDEIDELIKDREAKTTEFENNVLTSMMLTKLNALKKNDRIIYFVNTNLYHKIDDAIKREGRFDWVIFLGMFKNDVIEIMNKNKIISSNINFIEKYDGEKISQFSKEHWRIFSIFAKDYLFSNDLSKTLDKFKTFIDGNPKYKELFKDIFYENTQQQPV